MAINKTAYYVKMLYYSKVDTWERIDVNKASKSKLSMICHYWYFLNTGYKYEPELCYDCVDISMMANELKNIAILNIKGRLQMCCMEYE